MEHSEDHELGSKNMKLCYSFFARAELFIVCQSSASDHSRTRTQDFNLQRIRVFCIHIITSARSSLYSRHIVDHRFVDVRERKYIRER